MNTLTTATSPTPTAGQLEKYSSAVTLSDMEIFVFPELLYSLVLGNIMSPRIWAWRDHDWFKDIHKLKPYRRVLRLKQFIIDHYEFNLDLDTWGLTTKERELARFAPWMDEATISQSNALFGYEGDQYYFTLDIRRHFGLDKYTSDVIPYWKTETVEAMDAFRHKSGFARGAGECVSLSTLYAAALFVVCGIPLRDIYLMATPLHSQNFLDLGDGVLTNNRRIVTKNMWFNGTEQSAKAARALRHEQVTIVAHHTGYLHCVYPEASMDPAAYDRFTGSLRRYLTTDITMEIMANFLRDSSPLQKCFQVRYDSHGKARYIPAERVYAYEHNSAFKVSDATRDKLLAEIDEDEFYPNPMEGRLLLNKFDDFFKKGHVDIAKPGDIERLAAALDCQCSKSRDVVNQLVAFARLEPRLPRREGHTRFVPQPPLDLDTGWTRDEIIRHLESQRATHPIADLAFYAARDMARADWAPVLKAALERSPVCIRATQALDDAQVVQALAALPSESIYDGTRVAQPDEVWNYSRGDGLERALCLATILKARHAAMEFRLQVIEGQARLAYGGETVTWPSEKSVTVDLRF
jgi:hypothetical protein